ncbi:uncharacterized protein LOC111253953 [Varroa destructor]|uniref:TM2 domain-containing protein n=1 Tax=Varroa destructor TaxID=109461 RepID=A0A7M7KSG9_VARDE|nr:uncharacterized protein LOC111253953 [Varroa destructor]
MLWRTRGPHRLPEPHEDILPPLQVSPFFGRSRYRLKGDEWMGREAGASDTVTNRSSYNCSSSYSTWCCPTADRIVLVNNNNNNNNHSLDVVPTSHGIRDADATKEDVQGFQRFTDHSSHSGISDFRQKSIVSSGHTQAVKDRLLPTITEVSSLVGVLPKKTDWISTRSLAVIKKTISRITGGGFSEHRYCHKRFQTNEDKNLVHIDRVNDYKGELNRYTTLSAVLTIVRPSPDQASLVSTCSSSASKHPCQHASRSRQHGSICRFTSLNVVVISVLFLLVFLAGPAYCGHYVHCGKLLIGQYRCPEPEIDVITQQVSGCYSNNSAPVVCTLAPEIFCLGGTGINDTHFISEVPCEWTNGYSFEFSLLLSVFLGWLGLDRLYLGYPGLALAKFCTLGGIFLWQLIDIVLIAMQVVRPADGSQYVVSYFGPRLTRLSLNNETQILPQDDW